MVIYLITQLDIYNKIKKLDFPTINNLSKELGANRNYISIHLAGLVEEGKITFIEIGNTKIFKVVKK